MFVYAGASYCESLGVASLCVSRSLVVSLRKQESLPVTLEHPPTPRAARYINITSSGAVALRSSGDSAVCVCV